MESIKLHGSDVEKLHVNDWDFSEDGKPNNESKQVKGFENWYVTADKQTGDFESSKSAMVDFEMCLYDDKGEFRGYTNGGYYNEGCGYQFDFSSDHYYIFEPPAPETPEDKFNEFLADVADENISIKQKFAKIKKYVEKLEA